VEPVVSLWAVLIPILVADVLNPALLAAMIFALGTPAPFRNALALLLGHTVTYLVMGVALGVLLALGLYNLLYAVPFAALIALRWLYRRETEWLLAWLRAAMERVGSFLLPALLLLLGGALVADGAAFFRRGKPLF
jgi:hypothetical protein